MIPFLRSWEASQVMDDNASGSTGLPIRTRGRDRCPCCGAAIHSAAHERPFKIVDAMILVASSALAFLILRPMMSETVLGRPGWPRYLAVTVALLVSLTPTTLYLRLRQPRPRLTRLARQPGFAASLAGTAVLLLGALAIGLLALVRLARQGRASRIAGMIPNPRTTYPQDPAWWLGVVLHFGAVVGPAVMGAWLLLAFSGRRRPAKGWLDPLGRIIGTAWIILFIINCCARLAYLKN